MSGVVPMGGRQTQVVRHAGRVSTVTGASPSTSTDSVTERAGWQELYEPRHKYEVGFYQYHKR